MTKCDFNKVALHLIKIIISSYKSCTVISKRYYSNDRNFIVLFRVNTA